MENMGEVGDQQISEPARAASTVPLEPVEPGDPVRRAEPPPDLLSVHDIVRSDAAAASAAAVSVAADEVSVSSTMIDASDFRALAEPTYQTLNGRMSPGFSTANSYATLTPLQPLPPISTMSDKFSHYGHTGNVSGSFTLMQNNLGMGMNSYQYEKLGTMAGMNMNPTLGAAHHSAVSMMAANGLGTQQGGIPSPPYSQNGLHSPEKNMSPNGYETYAHRDLSRGLGSPQSPTVSLHSPTTMMNSLNGLNTTHSIPTSHLQVVTNTPPRSHHDVKPATTLTAPTPVPPPSLAAPAPTPTPAGVPLTQPSAPIQASVPNSMSNLVVAATNINKLTSSASSSKMNSADEVEEINTKELAQRISAELKRYSIPQAIFAQRVLCRSQGTLSDLLRNPKPWSKLKSGRETFRRMYKWLEEPEFQRMSALRLADTHGIKLKEVLSIQKKEARTSTTYMRTTEDKAPSSYDLPCSSSDLCICMT